MQSKALKLHRCSLALSGLVNSISEEGHCFSLFWDLRAVRVSALGSLSCICGGGLVDTVLRFKIRFRVEGLEFRVSGLGFRVQGFEFRVWG